ncbi:MAG: hypothetical protein B7Y96_00165 [Comamonadaceae bacterium 32-67-11]|nr:MAG: hypothetical protein B7Y96_00165 [Comamonadaceae bacterium 32-67-11]
MNPQSQRALLTILVQAAMADGQKADSERQFIRELALQLDADAGGAHLAQALQDALLKRVTLAQAVALLDDAEQRQLAYEWALAVCDADGVASTAEQAFLSQLRAALGLTGGAAAQELEQLERQTHSVAAAAYADDFLDADERAPAAAPTAAPSQWARAAPLVAAGAAALGVAGVGGALAARAGASGVSNQAGVQVGGAQVGGAAGSAALAASTPALDKMILNYAILNGALELLPQSWATVAIIPLQIKMVYRIGKAHGVALDQGHIREFIAAAGVGLGSQYLEQFGRRLLGGLVGKAAGRMAGGLAGRATGVAFSFATTYALGQLAKRYYAGGRVMSTDVLRQTFQGLLGPAKNLQQQHLPEIQARARTLNAGEVMRLVKGGI